MQMTLLRDHLLNIISSWMMCLHVPFPLLGTKYTGSCKFCSDGIVDNQTTETILNIAQNMVS